MGQPATDGGTPSVRRMHRCVWTACVALALAALTGGCSDSADTTAGPPPRQAGQPVNPYVVAGHVAAADVAAAAGNPRAAQVQLEAARKDMPRSMRVPDPAQPIDPEAARAAIRRLRGVRAVVWMDRQNLLVMVDGQRYRGMDTIDRICEALEPLGDTLAVVVNLQDITARNGDEAVTLSRNCQLPEGERALGQRKRQVDAIDPQLRRTFQAQQPGN